MLFRYISYHPAFFSCREEGKCIKIPRDMDDAKALGKVLSKYKDTFYVQVLVAYFATYVLYPFSDRRMLSFFLSERDTKNTDLPINFSI